MTSRSSVAARPGLVLGIAAAVVCATSTCHGPDRASAAMSAGSSWLSPRGPLPRAGAPRTTRRGVTASNLSRSYLLVAPAHPDPARRYPVILGFHGDGGDGAGQQRHASLETWSGDSALVVYPDGIGRTWDLEALEGNKDVAFVEAILNDVAGVYSVDRSQIFATGYSNGGFFANVLACHRSGLIRAIASSAGGAPYHQAEAWPNGFPRCPGEAPVAALALHGEQDFGVTLDSGRFTAEYWAYIDGCRMDETEATGFPECRAYRGCNAGKDVVFCQVPGLGHTIWEHAAEATLAFFVHEGMTP